MRTSIEPSATRVAPASPARPRRPWSATTSTAGPRRPWIASLTIGLALAASCSLTACSGSSGGDTPAGEGQGGGGSGQGGTGQGGGAGGEGPTCAENQNDAIRLALAPTCESCHRATASKPFFASLQTFEALLVYNEDYVVKGKPDQSKLVALLEGTATGTYKQMPLGDQSFGDLTTQSKTSVTIEQIRAWITSLPAQDGASDKPDLTAASTRRLRAEEFLKAVQVALGYPSASGGIPPLLGGSMQPLSPDSPTVIDYNDDSRRQVYSMLGGPSYMDSRAPEKSLSPSSLAVINQIALRECSQAVQANSPAVFKFASASDTVPASEAAVRKNLAYLHRRFLGLTASDDDTTALLQQVFVPAAARGPAVAWVESCAALIRHPHFLTF